MPRRFPSLFTQTGVAMRLFGFLWWSSQPSIPDLSAAANVTRHLPPSFDNGQAWSNQFKPPAVMISIQIHLVESEIFLLNLTASH